MTKVDKQAAEEIAALRKEVEALKAAQPKPEPEFKERPFQRYDPHQSAIHWRRPRLRFWHRLGTLNTVVATSWCCPG